LNQPVDPYKLIEQSSLVYSAEEIESAIDQVASQLNLLIGQTPIVIMCVMSGGLYFSGKLLAKLKMPVELDYVQANRYQNKLSGGDLVWTKSPSIPLHQKTVVLVDDILDEGLTLSGVSKKCLALGASRVITAVLTDKENDLKKPLKADFVGMKVPNQFVFGCGMDAFGWWRNLPEIRALSSTYEAEN
jgi:hypoxanthine phosphoribosyltransferase